MRRWIVGGGVVLLLAGAGLQARRASILLRADRQAAEVARVASLVQSGRAPARSLVPWIRVLREASAADPGNLRVAAARGDLFLLLGREEAAVAAYDEALAIEARSEIYFNRSLALERLAREREAAADRRRAFLLDPRMGRTYRRDQRSSAVP